MFRFPPPTSFRPLYLFCFVFFVLPNLKLGSVIPSFINHTISIYM